MYTWCHNISWRSDDKLFISLSVKSQILQHEMFVWLNCYKKFYYVQFYFDNPFIPNLCILFRPHSYDEPQIDIFPLSHSIYRSESKDCVPIIQKFQRFSSVLFLESAFFASPSKSQKKRKWKMSKIDFDRNVCKLIQFTFV